MTYTKTTWQDGVTPVNAANLNKIEDGIAANDASLTTGYLPISSAVSAGSGVQSNKLLAGDANPAYVRMGDGRLWWGPGGASGVDTTLWRSGAGALQTDGDLTVIGALSAGNASLLSYGNGHTYALRNTFNVFAAQANFGSPTSLRIDSANGKHSWGPGDGNFDTTLYRTAAGILKTDGMLYVVNFIAAQLGTNQVIAGEISNFVGGAVRPGLVFGAANDTNLYRSSAQNLKTDGSFWAGNSIIVDTNGGGGKLYFGAALDTALSRTTEIAGSTRLKTDNYFMAPGYTCKPGTAGAYLVQRFNIEWTTTAQLWIDTINLGTISFTSDARYKKNIKPLKSTWEAVKDLAPISYRWRDKSIFKDDGKDHVGFLAQDVLASIPSGVFAPQTPEGKDDEDQPLSLNILDIISTMCKTLQEAQLRIEALEGLVVVEPT